MTPLTPSQLVTLGSWGIAAIYYNVPARLVFTNYARTSFLSLKAALGVAPTQDDVLPLLHADIMTEPLFISVVSGKHPYIHYRNAPLGSLFSRLAELFAIYILTKEWSVISV